MYQRSYSEENEISPPRVYDGSIQFDTPPKVCEEKREPESFIGKIEGWLHSLLPKGLDIGLEEILIIGAAIVIFTSGTRDYECLFILLALLFVK